MAAPSLRPHEYWNPTLELMPREQLRALQLDRLRNVVAWAYARSPFWRQKLDTAAVQPEGIRHLDDVRRLPFLTKQELLDAQAAHPPYGELLTASPEVAVDYHPTSGTSGRVPYRAIQSTRDWAWGANAWARGLYAFGLRRSDVVYFPFTYGPFIAFWGAHYAVQRIGATTMAGGSQSSEARIRQLLDVGATAIAVTPSYAIRLGQVAASMGIDLAADSRVRLTFHAGEPGPGIPSTRALPEGMWGARAGDFLGMTETGGITAYECSEQRGPHISEDYFLEEVLDPESGEPVAEGEIGERVSTALSVGLIPILRYRTGDLVRRVPGASCRCGRTFDLYQGGVLGRADDMRVIRGTNVYPSAIEGVVRRFPEIREFRIVLTRVGALDEITVEIEPANGAHELEGLVPKLVVELAEANEGLRFAVQVVPEGTLPVFELKARRLVDRREGAAL